MSVDAGSVHSRIGVRRIPAARARAFFVPSLATWGASATSISTSFPIPSKAFPISCKCSRNRGRSVSSVIDSDQRVRAHSPKTLRWTRMGPLTAKLRVGQGKSPLLGASLSGVRPFHPPQDPRTLISGNSRLHRALGHCFFFLNNPVLDRPTRPSAGEAVNRGPPRPGAVRLSRTPSSPHRRRERGTAYLRGSGARTADQLQRTAGSRAGGQSQAA